MTTRIKLRRDTAANWTANNPILAAGEPGLEIDTTKIKYGDGITEWTSLAYAGGDTLTDEGSVVITAGSTEHWIATQSRDNYNTYPKGLRYDSLGNLYSLTGAWDGNNNYYIAIITKYTATGAIAWQKSFGDRYPLSLAIDSNNRAYITYTAGDMLPFVGVFKFETTGAILWQKEYEVGSIAAYDAFIEEKSATTLALVCSGSDQAPGSNMIIAMEISASTGAVEIKRRIAFDALDQYVFVTGLDVDPDENVFITGSHNNSVDNVNNMFIEKLDQNLGRVWSKSIDVGSTYNVNGGDCASDALGNIYAVGAYQVETMANSDPDNASQQSAGILVKLNSSGAIQWTRRLGPGPCGSFIAGLTATDTGDVYLSAATFVNSNQEQAVEYGQEVQEDFGDNKMIVVRYTTTGDVVWQRYVDVAHLSERPHDLSDGDSRGQAIAVFEDKFAVDGHGNTWNTTPYNNGYSNDIEDDYFVVQLPTAGTDLTIGDLHFTESRIPGRFITPETVTTPLVNIAYTGTISVENVTINADEAARVANNIVNSDTYAYTFGADGTLTIPNDGDLRLTQSQIGYMMSIGSTNNFNENYYNAVTAVDAEGNMYVGGEESNNYDSIVTKISPTGERLWGVRIVEDDEGWENGVRGLVVNPTTNSVTAILSVDASDWYGAVVTLDKDTGRIISNTEYRDSGDDIYLDGITLDSNNEPIIVGRKYGEFIPPITVTPETGSSTGTIKILRSAIPNIYPSGWQIGGTGITGYENIDSVEYYPGLTGTVRQGTGATFDIIDNGNGTYSASISTSTTSTNYLPGHKIKILGTNLGGATPDNDCVLTVATAEAGVIGLVTNSGTAASTGTVTYTAVSGANTDVGSGFTMTLVGPFDDDNYDFWMDRVVTNQGTNYVNLDVVVIPGTSLGGTSPANDLTVELYVDGNVYINNTLGTAQSTTWKLGTVTQVDFANTGTWTIQYPLSQESLLITDGWSRTFGTNGNSTDFLTAVARDSGNNIIAVGRGTGETSIDRTDDLAIVYKFSSTGTLLWTRKLNDENDDCQARSVTTIGTDIYVTHDNDSSDTIISKLDASGTVKWQRITEAANNYNSSIAVTSDGNLLVVAEAYNEDINNEAVKVFLLSPAGEVIYKRWLMATTDSTTRLDEHRCLAVVGDKFYVSCTYNTNNNQSIFVAQLPVDGSGTGEYGSFRYVDVLAEGGLGIGNENAQDNTNYTISELDLENSDNYAGPLADGEEVYIKSTDTYTTGEGVYRVESFFPSIVVETVRDTDGGAIIFPDGTKQTTSATEWPQTRFFGQRYTVGMNDRGGHILCTESTDSILLPYNSRVELPIGTVVRVVNTTGSWIEVQVEGGGTQLMVAGFGYFYSGYVTNYGVATLLKVGRDEWHMSGNVDVN